MGAAELWAAVLQRALKDYTHGLTETELRAYARQVREDAEKWLTSKSEEPRSFRWVCYQLGLEPGAVWSSARRERYNKS